MAHVADVFLVPARNIIIHTTPGRDVKFYGGHAKVVDHRDMPFVLAMPDARVIPAEGACSWAEQWLSNTQELRAAVEWPEGYSVDHTNKDEWSIERPEGTSVSLPGEPDESPELVPEWPKGGKSLVDVLMQPERKPRKRTKASA